MERRMKFVIILLLLWSVKAIAQPACPSRCGDVSIDYPFGIGVGCYLDSWFSIDCVQSKPFLSGLKLEVLNISVEDSTIRVNYPTISSCNDPYIQVNVSLNTSNFFFSESRNKFVATGCDNLAYMQAQDGSIISGCMSLCPKNTFVNRSNCNGVNCCQTTIPPDMVEFSTSMVTIDFNRNHESCKSTFLVEEEWFQSADTSHSWSHVPVILGWGISELPKVTYSFALSAYQCSNRSRADGNSAFVCSCQSGFHGNPYISDGCQDIDECENLYYFPCKYNGSGTFPICVNTFGSYKCYWRSIEVETKSMALTIGSFYKETAGSGC